MTILVPVIQQENNNVSDVIPHLEPPFLCGCKFGLKIATQVQPIELSCFYTHNSCYVIIIYVVCLSSRAQLLLCVAFPQLLWGRKALITWKRHARPYYLTC
jgi:hypothetical protein